MSRGDPLGMEPVPAAAPDQPARIEHVIVQRPLDRVLAFTGHSIDDIINDPVARHRVMGYWKLHRFIERRSEMLDLERAWNPQGRRV